MPRYLRIFGLALLVFLSGSSLVAEGRPKPAATAFLLSIFVGFGSGQSYCGTSGFGFLIVDSIGIGLVIYGLPGSSASLAEGLTNAARVELSGLILLASHIWQIIDVFGAVDAAKRAGRIADVAPVIDVDIQRTGFELEVSLKY